MAVPIFVGNGRRARGVSRRVYLDEAGEVRFREAGDGRGAAHPPVMDFQVHTRDPAHPIMAGLPAVWMHANDELYHDLRGPAIGMHILATARVPTGEWAPVLWTKEHGQGRVFVTTLGHHRAAIDSLGLMTTLVRGLEWAATGQVTSRLPINFPGADDPAVEPPRFLR